MRMKSAAVRLAVAFAACLASLSAAGRWVDSFERYKSTMRPLNPAAAKTCEGHLRRILTSIDENQSCGSDSECALVGEEPFGPTVPVRTNNRDTVLADMKQFRQACYDESHAVHHNTDLVHMPACVKTRCMVKTSEKR
jgi:hypothetical protein